MIVRGWVSCARPNHRSVGDFLGLATQKNVIITGGYQLYFYPQHHFHPLDVTLMTPSVVDFILPAIPQIFLIYSILYYLAFNVVFLWLPDFGIPLMAAYSMLLHNMLWALIYPTKSDMNFLASISSPSKGRNARVLHVAA